MVDRAAVSAWLNAYVTAWKSYDKDAIRALFSEDAVYMHNPFTTKPLQGREAIIEDWFKHPDAPGSFDAHYEPIAVDGDTVVTNGRTTYYEPGTQKVTSRFDNIFVLRFDDQGRCVEFREWWMTPRKGGG